MWNVKIKLKLKFGLLYKFKIKFNEATNESIFIWTRLLKRFSYFGLGLSIFLIFVIAKIISEECSSPATTPLSQTSEEPSSSTI